MIAQSIQDKIFSYSHLVTFSNRTHQKKFIGFLELTVEKKTQNVSLKSILKLELRGQTWCLSLKDRASLEIDYDLIQILWFKFTNKEFKTVYNQEVKKDDIFFLPLYEESNSDDLFRIELEKNQYLGCDHQYLPNEDCIILSKPPFYRRFNTHYSMVANAQSQYPLGILQLSVDAVDKVGLRHAIKVELENGICYLRGKTLKIPDNQEFPTVKIRSFTIVKGDGTVHSKRHELRDNSELNIQLFPQSWLFHLSHIAFTIISNSVLMEEEFIPSHVINKVIDIKPQIVSNTPIGTVPLPVMTLQLPVLPPIRSVFPDLFEPKD